uniref:Short-chain dehydrogenase/reductase SDR n=1 Tax=uncultured microorganism TaxID=358574 RepID=F8UH60_9ZZZZ|nr:short-chain dehydrogenase/reductase SDR [uncultured microorganism]
MNAPRTDSVVGERVCRYGAWAVVTGASDGIGRAFAAELAAHGLHLVVVARRGERLRALAQELASQHGTQTRVLALDLGHSGALDTLRAATADLDVGLLVAAAGYGSTGPLAASDLACELDQLQVNVGAVLAQCWHFGRTFAERGRGGIVLMSSVVAFQGTPMSANYAATKAYVQSLAEALQRELKPCGVDVIASAPGPVGTGFAERARMRMASAENPAVVAGETLRALGRRTTVRPGGLAKLLGWSLATAPRALRVQIMGRIMGGMTVTQRRVG